MGVIMSSGNKKYVFTAAAAPTGEGEVEGSLWYNTVTNTLYTYDGTTWLLVSTGSFIYVGEDVVTGSASTSIEVTGLDLNSDGCYLVLINCETAAAPSSIHLEYNNDTTASHYGNSYTRFTGSTVSGAAADTSVLHYAGNGESYFTRMFITQNLATDETHAIVDTMEGYNGRYRQTGSHLWQGSGANVTSIKYKSANANALGVGTKIIVYKVTP